MRFYGLNSGTVSFQWKHDHVSPIFKNGNRSDAKSYRPISLTSVICKVMEHIIVSQVMKHLEQHNILSESQCSFRLQRSCESQLFITLNDITKAVDNKLQVDVAILDFSKAFNKVVHSGKLDHYGNLLNWLKSFLSDQVVVDGIKSSICSNIWGPSGVCTWPSTVLKLYK